jgi:mRNA-degrading endonuclease RelE of RelBE toxin-antitoxin system
VTVLPYRAAFTRSFLRELKNLPDDVKSQVLEAINDILANPFTGVKLRDELEGYWRWRAGKWMIYLIDRESQIVVFLDVGYRKAIYE